MNPIKEFENEVEERLKLNSDNKPFQDISNDFLVKSLEEKYSYNFSWMGRPVIQYPQDVFVMQEIIWDVKPDVIIETGIAHGGSLIFSASMLSLLETCGEIENGRVLGIDIDIRDHNKQAILDHPMSKKITMLEGSSIDEAIVNQVKEFASTGKKVLVCLDSNHTHDHVLAELNAYAELADIGSYCVVFDTVIEQLPQGSFPDRPWDKGDNPYTAVTEFLKTNDKFVIDQDIDNKVMVTVSPQGYLKRVK